MSFFFFFKQKTAYEMRISDWSSDVCSSDLAGDAEKLDSRLRGNDELKEKWAQVRTQREAVTEAIEPYRREKTNRSSLEAEVTIHDPAHDTAEIEEVFIVSVVRTGDELTVKRTTNHKCGSCWRNLHQVETDGGS